MTRDDIIRMARKCQLIGEGHELDGMYLQALSQFAAIVASAEREACAEIAWERFGMAGRHIASAIRARGEA